MSGPVSVDVCVATFRRPAELARLLASLQAQDLPARVKMRVVVVDNDAERSAQPTVSACGPVLYAVEPEQSIARARNRALDLAEADYVAFIDDDEVASTRWLRALVEASERYGADVVFGPVVSVLPPDAPLWARRHPQWNLPRLATGTHVTLGATNNALVRRSALGDPPRRFALAYGLTGGSDAELFHALHVEHRRMVWCDEAVVEEIVPAYRVDRRWLFRRAFRHGQTHYRVFAEGQPLRTRSAVLATSAWRLVRAVARAPVARLSSARVFADASTAIAYHSGRVAAAMSHRYFREYDADRYA